MKGSQNNWHKKNVLLAGVGGGIGKEILKQFTRMVNNLISVSRTESKEDIWDEKWGEMPKNYSHYSYDLTSEENVVDLCKEVKDTYGHIDVLINTVGGSLYSHKIEEFPLEQFKRVIDVNLTSAFLLTKHGIRLMKENKEGGHIIHFVSSSAKKISHNKAPYGSAKAGLAHFIHYASVEAAPYQIKVNGITPTYVFTERHIDGIKKKAEKRNVPLEKLEDEMVSSQVLPSKLFPVDLVPVVELLSSSNVITGQIYNVTLGEVLDY